MGSLESAINTRELLKLGITHILDVSSVEYYKRVKYFQYNSVPVYNNHDEDIKKFFRITNRFIEEAINNKEPMKNGKVLIQGEKGTSRAPSFAIAYLINNKRITFKEAISMVTSKMAVVEINDYFKKQLEDYDLGKLATVSKEKQDKN